MSGTEAKDYGLIDEVIVRAAEKETAGSNGA